MDPSQRVLYDARAWLRKRLAELQMGVGELAKACEKRSEKTAGRWVLGKTTPSLSDQITIAVAVHMEVDDVLARFEAERSESGDGMSEMGFGPASSGTDGDGLTSSTLKLDSDGCGESNIASDEYLFARSAGALGMPGAEQATAAPQLQNVMDKLFSRTAPGDGTLVAAMVPEQNLDERVRKARGGQRNRPLLVLVGGYAGSGKSEFGKALARVTGWAVIDKDVTARPMTEQLLQARGADPNDRHSELYLDHVRPLEYRSTMEAACRSLECKLSTVVTAPFLRELNDESWCSRLIHRCASLGADVAFVWVDCDLPTMHDHIRQRGAARDAWKLAHWDEYEATVDIRMRPCVSHIVVDNRYNAAICLADQAAAIADQVSFDGQA